MNAEIKEKLRVALPYIRSALKDARGEAGGDGVVHLGILAVRADKSGKVICQFEAGEFFHDLAVAFDLPTENTEEEDLEADALAFLQKHGLK